MNAPKERYNILNPANETRDEDRLTEAEQALVLAAKAWAIELAHKYIRGHGIKFGSAQAEDIKASAWAGLVRAAKKYDPEQAEWTTYATFWVKSQIQLDVEGGRRHDYTPQNPLPEVYSNWEWCDEVAPYISVECHDLMTTVREVMRKMRMFPMARKVLEIHLGDTSLTYKEIGAIVGLTAGGVEHNLSVVLPRLRAELVKRGVGP